MRTAWLAVAVLALAACGKTDPLTQAHTACANGEGDAQSRIAACSTLIDSGDLDDASRAAALVNRGTAIREGGDVTAALRDFDAALNADADNMQATMARAEILIDSGQLDAAETLVERLVASGAFPDNAHFLVGLIAAQRSDFTAAVVAYDAAIEANPRFDRALANRARIKQVQGDLAGALADYDAAIGVNPQLSTALAGRCWSRVLMEDGDVMLARADADAAVAADPREASGQLCRGLLQLRASEWEGALGSYEAVLAIEPGRPEALFGRGVARRRSGDEQGREDMNLARDFDRHIGETFDELGVRTF
jgi:tetratricopeptide (TPR) repeat protein